MKHIIIAGCSRTGKTTLSELFTKKGFIHYKMDSIKRAIYKSFSIDESKDWKNISPKMAKLVSTIINETSSDKIYNHEFYCIDTCHLYPIDINKEDLKNTIIIFLGYPNIDKNKKLYEIRKYDQSNIWTSNKSDEEILNNIELGIKYSIEAKKQCDFLGIPFFDTSYDFNKAINDAYNYIKKELIKEDKLNYMNWREERNIARITDNPSKFLEHPNFLVRDGLLNNPNITPEIFEKLSQDNSTQIREKLAKLFIEKAVNDANWRVRYAAINDNPEIPYELLNRLINDEDMRIRMKARRLLEIQNEYTYRKDFDNAITIKLVIPGTCNANCSFCYNKHSNKMEISTTKLKQQWLDNFLLSLEQIVLKIDGKQPISIDITGNEPTLDTDFFIQVMHRLRSFSLKNKICRITCTTNGIGLKKVAPFMKDVVNYVNISVHDYDQERRNNIFTTYFPTDKDYEEAIQLLLDNKIHTSAIAVIHNEIKDFPSWRDNFIKWADKIGFVSLRFRHNVYYDNNSFLNYMNDTINDERFYTIQKENTPDSNWCQLTTKDGFLVFFLKGVIDTYAVSPGIEFIVHDDGKAYADFNKTIPFSEYDFPIGYVYDKKAKTLSKIK